MMCILSGLELYAMLNLMRKAAKLVAILALNGMIVQVFPLLLLASVILVGFYMADHGVPGFIAFVLYGIFLAVVSVFVDRKIKSLKSKSSHDTNKP
jgi:hypothetical protein